MEEEKYLIICLRNNAWNKSENILFWGKNRSGYYTDLSRVGLYTKTEAKRLCRSGDCYISMDTLGITKEMMDFKNENVQMQVAKTSKVCKYVNAFKKIMDNKHYLRYGY